MENVKCTGVMCEYQKNGVCTAEKIEIVNVEIWIEEEKEYQDFQRCGTFRKDINWASK